ncbi:MAG TPA: hypothetical protein ENJ05_02225 [Thiotrichales bacterium]|nr:hypothetical protein [Thiotrichales bacterium]
MNHKDFSDETLNAFVDGELDAAGRDELFEALGRNRALSHETCELRRLGEMVRHAYDTPPGIDRYRQRTGTRPNRWTQGLAASLLLALGGLLGWAVHQPDTGLHDDSLPLSVMYWDEDKAFQNTDIRKVVAQQGTKRVIVHLNTSSAARFGRALDTAERLLQTYGEEDAEIEIVANASAIRMLRAGYSPYAERVHELQQRYINLTFLACQDAIDHAREIEGGKTEVQLLPDVAVTPSALEHILHRLSEGWVYLNV